MEPPNFIIDDILRRCFEQGRNGWSVSRAYAAGYMTGMGLTVQELATGRAGGLRAIQGHGKCDDDCTLSNQKVHETPSLFTRIARSMSSEFIVQTHFVTGRVPKEFVLCV